MYCMQKWMHSEKVSAFRGYLLCITCHGEDVYTHDLIWPSSLSEVPCHAPVEALALAVSIWGVGEASVKNLGMSLQWSPASAEVAWIKTVTTGNFPPLWSCPIQEMGGSHLCPSAIPRQIVSTLQSAGKSLSPALHFQWGFFDEWYNLKGSEILSLSVTDSEPSKHLEASPKSETVCVMHFSPYLFFLLLFLLASVSPVEHTLTFLMLDTSKPCS